MTRLIKIFEEEIRIRASQLENANYGAIKKRKKILDSTQEFQRFAENLDNLKYAKRPKFNSR